MWSVPRAWNDETAFIVCGGPSVTNDQLLRLRGGRVIVINSSYMSAPWADYLVFTDSRWWIQHRHHVKRVFKGEVVTITPARFSQDIHVLDRQRSGGLSMDPTRLTCWHTTVTTAVNLAVLLGVKRVGLLGLDGQNAPDGRLWHHMPHPEVWGTNPKRYQYHGEALAALVGPLKDAGVVALNLNRSSAHTMFPFTDLDELL